ncbi:MAG: hypothetical protein KDD99_03405, partial [Bacteroidetes bacterium]|nr:hypothetical protein [Bacteroidota bacterium]
LQDVAVVFIMDGTQVTIDAQEQEKWITGLVIPGNEKEFMLNGPITNSIPDSCVLGLTIYDMPTVYNEAGNVKKKENFEWYFYYGHRDLQKTAEIRYDYQNRPVFKESCHQCNAVGYHAEVVQCGVCDGKGKYTTSKGKIVTCYKCSGKGKYQDKKDCTYCDDGKIAHRKSQDPSIDEAWSGYKVAVATTPSDSRIFVVDPSTKEYTPARPINGKIDWWAYSSKNRTKVYPIKIVHQDKEYNITPENAKGRMSSTVSIDLSSGEPVVKNGKLIK